MLEKFKNITNKEYKKGSISFEEFSNYLLLPPSDALREVFELYDRVSPVFISNLEDLPCGLLVSLWLLTVQSH